ncbi:TPA: hypothetical protein U3R04_001556 [Streptococcus agalactiae]|uniref:hypothetical protein n=1 Tax=Streptococcus agalactiae TaxID=1311 RepID=UPI0018858C28|nr:hypothetical protein [Streptococcus agalactiae]HEN0691858.1 hypothetical protein [Streptococcus agalactiae]HEN0709475.1 hypothetical protein [Streptococcus agalactiae]
MKLKQLIGGKIQYLEHQNKRLASLSKNQLELLIQTNASPKEYMDFYNDLRTL